jgi:hypothetical protein
MAGTLPASRFGGPPTTRAMIHVTWHLTTTAFLTVGSALLLSGAALHGGAARAIALIGASAYTAFAAVAIPQRIVAVGVVRVAWTGGRMLVVSGVVATRVLLGDSGHAGSRG